MRPRLRNLTPKSVLDEVKNWYPAGTVLPEAAISTVLTCAQGLISPSPQVRDAYLRVLPIYEPAHPGIRGQYPWEMLSLDPVYELDVMMIGYHGRVAIAQGDPVSHTMLAVLAGWKVQSVRNAVCAGELVVVDVGRRKGIDADLAKRWLEHRQAAELRAAHDVPKVAS